jgi:hypothetical protein
MKTLILKRIAPRREFLDLQVLDTITELLKDLSLPSRQLVLDNVYFQSGFHQSLNVTNTKFSTLCFLIHDFTKARSN